MEKLFFAIGNEAVENRICKVLEEKGFEFEVVFKAVHKESVISEISSKKPTVLLITEGLPGKTDAYMLATSIRKSFPYIRIIFLAEANPDNAKIASLVGFGIYDILMGEEISIQDMVNLILNKNDFEDATKYLPKDGNIFTNDNFDEISGGLEHQRGDLSAKSETIITVNASGKAKSIDDDDDEDEIKINNIIEDIDDDDIPTKKNSKNPEGDFIIEDYDDDNDEDSEQEFFEVKSKKNKNKHQMDTTKRPSALAGLGTMIVNGISKGRQKKVATEVVVPPQSTNTQEPPPPQQQPYQAPPWPQNGIPGFPQYQYPQPQYPGYYPPQPSQPVYPQYPEQMPLNQNQYYNQENNRDIQSIPMRNPMQRNVSTKQRLITFYSPKGGIGTTVTALNCAALSAKLYKKRVLFIEFNTIYSSSAYWFYLPNAGAGLEDALIGVGTNYSVVQEAIITKDKILKYDPNLEKYGISKIPESMDFLVFSSSFYKKQGPKQISPSNLEKLITYCLFTLNYDEIYLDVSSTTNREIIDTSLIISGKNVILMSQDLAIINSVVLFFTELNKKGLKFDISVEDVKDNIKGEITYKNIYVLNKYYDSGAFTINNIQEMIKCRNIIKIPEGGGQINSSLSVAYIPATTSMSKGLKESYNSLLKLLQ